MKAVLEKKIERATKILDAAYQPASDKPILASAVRLALDELRKGAIAPLPVAPSAVARFIVDTLKMNGAVLTAPPSRYDPVYIIENALRAVIERGDGAVVLERSSSLPNEAFVYDMAGRKNQKLKED